MGQLEDMTIFIRIVEAGGISKAAEQLNMTKSAISRRLSSLETHLDNQLLSRTTRSWTLTEAGQHYYQHACSILEEVDKLDQQTKSKKKAVSGTLKLTAPLSFGLMHLSKFIDHYTYQHPALKLQIDFSDRQIDLVEEGFELAIRIGQLENSTYQARPFTTVRKTLVASPEYLAASGIPAAPDTLGQYNYLQYGLHSTETVTLYSAAGQKTDIMMKGDINSNNGDFLMQMALRHKGVAFLPTFLVYQEILAGRLVEVFPDVTFNTLTAYLVYPQNRFQSQRSRALIDYLVEEFKDEPYWDRELSLWKQTIKA